MGFFSKIWRFILINKQNISITYYSNIIAYISFMGFYRQQKGLLMIHTKDQIAEAMKLIPTLTEDEIVHQFKCASSKKHIAYKGYMEALHKELRKKQKDRGVVEHVEES